MTQQTVLSTVTADVFILLVHGVCKRRKVSLRDRLQNSNSSERSESLQGLSLSASCSAPATYAAGRPMSKRKSADANDLRVDDPKQVRLWAYPVTKKRCFNAAWYQRWDWLEYSVKYDATFCFLCRNFKSKAGGYFPGMRCESTFTTNGCRNWKHTTEMNRGFFMHTASKKHLACYSTWKEKVKRFEMVKDIAALVDIEAIEKKSLLFLYLN